MAGEISFDVVSDFDEQELRNALRAADGKGVRIIGALSRPGRAAEVPDAGSVRPVPVPSPVRCARCGHASRFVRHDTLARVRPAPGPARRPPP